MAAIVCKEILFSVPPAVSSVSLVNLSQRQFYRFLKAKCYLFMFLQCIYKYCIVRNRRTLNQPQVNPIEQTRQRQAILAHR